MLGSRARSNPSSTNCSCDSQHYLPSWNWPSNVTASSARRRAKHHLRPQIQSFLSNHSFDNPKHLSHPPHPRSWTHSNAPLLKKKKTGTAQTRRTCDLYELKSDDIIEFRIDIVGKDNKTIMLDKVAAHVVCGFHNKTSPHALNNTNNTSFGTGNNSINTLNAASQTNQLQLALPRSRP